MKPTTMNPVIAAPVVATLLVWIASLFAAAPFSDAHPLWIAQRQALHLSGLLAIVLLSLAMLLSLRSEWLLARTGGKAARFLSHRLAGTAGVACGLLHWLIDRSGGLLRTTIGRSGQLPKESLGGSLEMLRHVAKDAGEWALWIVLPLAVLAAWRMLPSPRTRSLHRVMPLAYLLLAFHAALMAPAGWWAQAAGPLLACALLAGSWAALQSLRSRLIKPMQARALRAS